MPSHHWLQYTADIMKMFKIASFRGSLVHQYDALNELQAYLRLSDSVDRDADRLSAFKAN